MIATTLKGLRAQLIGFAAAAFLTTWSMPSWAALVSPVAVRLIAPGGYTDGFSLNPTPISESATVDITTGLLPGDLTNNISGFWMLPGESITFSGNSILFTLAPGADDGFLFTTGYLGSGSDPARYEIDGLAVSGETITGFTMSLLGVDVGGTATLSGAGNSLLSLRLDDLVITNSAGFFDSFAQIRIDLTTVPDNNGGGNNGGGNVPEPATWALALAAIAATRWTRRRGTER